LTDCRSGSTSRESGRLSDGGGSSRAVLFNNALRAGRLSQAAPGEPPARRVSTSRSSLRGGDDDDDDDVN